MAQLPDAFLQDFFERIAVAKSKFSKAQAYADGMERAISVVRAQITKSRTAGGKQSGGLSFQQANSEALTHPLYDAQLKCYAAALEHALEAEWDLKILEMEFGAWRTIAANQRAVM